MVPSALYRLLTVTHSDVHRSYLGSACGSLEFVAGGIQQGERRTRGEKTACKSALGEFNSWHHNLDLGTLNTCVNLLGDSGLIALLPFLICEH